MGGGPPSLSRKGLWATLPDEERGRQGDGVAAAQVAYSSADKRCNNHPSYVDRCGSTATNEILPPASSTLPETPEVGGTLQNGA